MSEDKNCEGRVADGILAVPNTTCTECGSTDFEMRNYEMAWHEGDIHCARCGEFIRRFDAG
jgi:ribosomal protein S27AE